jgi:hypothetical protein
MAGYRGSSIWPGTLPSATVKHGFLTRPFSVLLFGRRVASVVAAHACVAAHFPSTALACSHSHWLLPPELAIESS